MNDRKTTSNLGDSRDNFQGREPYVDSATVCRFLGIHKNTLRRLVSRGQIPGYRMAGWRFRLSEVERAMRSKANN